MWQTCMIRIHGYMYRNHTRVQWITYLDRLPGETVLVSRGDHYSFRMLNRKIKPNQFVFHYSVLILII